MNKFIKLIGNLIKAFFIAAIFYGSVQERLYAQDGFPAAGTIKTDNTGVEMVYVPAGTFQMGVEKDVLESLCSDLEIGIANCEDVALQEGILDSYNIKISGFWIDRYEVTIAQFEPYISFCTDQNICSLGYLNRVTETWPELFDDSAKPQVAIDWYTALRFCNSRGARLPTEEEWEYAASGPENLNFPWGNSIIIEDVLNYLSIQSTYPVGSKLGNVSWVGAYDLAGNIGEWVEDRFKPYPPRLSEWPYNQQLEFSRVYRGGSWGNGILEATTFRRYHTVAFDSNQTIGFRCARTSDPSVS